MDDSAVGGERITSVDQASRRSASGRTCAEPDCGTRLSIYNDGRFCALHEHNTAPRTRGRKIA